MHKLHCKAWMHLNAASECLGRLPLRPQHFVALQPANPEQPVSFSLFRPVVSEVNIYTTIKTRMLSVTEVGVAGWAWSLHGKQT